MTVCNIYVLIHNLALHLGRGATRKIYIKENSL